MTLHYFQTALLAFAVSALGFWSLPSASAQPFEPLVHQGDLNEDFTRGALTRYRSKASRAKRQSREEKSRDEFALNTAVALHREHVSGQILSGDWVSELVERLGAKVAAADAALSGKRAKPVRFYVTASPAVNAFATADRTVYVTMGLLARLESEAQLAYILSHELGHIDLGHNVDLYLKGEELSRLSDSRRGRRELAEDPFAINRYSRSSEQEADDYGSELYKTLGYPSTDVQEAFDMLSDSYLSFGEHVLAQSDLEIYDFVVPQEWMLEELVTPRSVAERLAKEREEEEAEELARQEEQSSRRARRRARKNKGNQQAEEKEAEGELDDDPSTHPATEERAAKAATLLGDLAGEQFQV